MPGWTVVIWATVTPDLVEAFEADLREATLALEAIAPEELHVHVIQTTPGTSGPTLRKWPGSVKIPNDVDSVSTLGEALAGASCWGTKDSPTARNRLLVLWGHGELFFPSVASPPAVPAADELVAQLTPEDSVMGSVAQQPATPDIIGYDACRMATVSNVQTLANTLPEAVFIGSMVPEPASGWPYVQLLRALREPAGPKAVAAAIVEAYAASVDAPDWCLVAVSLAGVAALGDKLVTLGSSTAPEPVEFYAAAAGADILDDTNLLDLGALMRRLSRITPHPEADAVLRALREATIARRAAGSLAGRDGLAARAGRPPSRGPVESWPPEPRWSAYLPELFPAQEATASLK